MQILIDTHVLIWYLNGDSRLSKKVRDIIDGDDHLVVVSVVSLWEIAMKLTKGNLEIEIPFEKLEAYLLSRNFAILGIGFSHLNIFVTLLSQHGDPFDRMLIAQAINANLVVASGDRHFPSYPIAVIW